MITKAIQLACPNCGSACSPFPDGNVLNTPLVCPACGQAFSPRFYCPDAKSPGHHIFAATALYIDSAGALYTFCPEHTFTTYALTPDSQPRPQRTPLQSLIRFFDSLIYRLTLTIESWRWRLASRR
ncbi:MAG: hypothetical protein HW418_3496, partial [Anaerolineales bacterium]|nr:hypothetical protein [Anaerolineales bacterium]